MTLRAAARLLVLPVMAAVIGCSSQTMTLSNPTLPAPLLEPLPLRVGIRYTPEMHDFTHHEELLANQEWTIHLGESNRLLYDQIFDAMFDEVVVIEDGQNPKDAGVDVLIEPSIDAFEFALPQQSRSETYTVWIRYRLRVFDKEGKEIANWPVSAYGKSGGGTFGGDKAMQRAAVLAMRDAAALVSLRFTKEAGLLSGDERPGKSSEPAERVAATPELPVAPTNKSEDEDEATKSTSEPKRTERFTNEQG